LDQSGSPAVKERLDALLGLGRKAERLPSYGNSQQRTIRTLSTRLVGNHLWECVKATLRPCHMCRGQVPRSSS